MEFANGGKPQTKLEVVGKAPRGRTGTTVTFWPDPTVFAAEGIEFLARTVLERLQMMAFLNKGLEIRFVDERPEPRAGGRRTGTPAASSTSCATSTRPRRRCSRGSAYYEADEDDQEVEVAFQWNTGYHEGIHSFANGIATIEGGMHEEGFKKALTNVVNKYARVGQEPC